MLEKVLGVCVMRCWLYLATKAPRVGPARRCLVLSLQWVMAPIQGCVAPGLGYLVEC
jgi:hypothetical protein